MYSILIKRNYYQGTLNVDKRWLVLEDNPYVDSNFKTRNDGLEAIDEMESRTYYLSHGEYSAPDYKVVKRGSRTYEVAYGRTYN